MSHAITDATGTATYILQTLCLGAFVVHEKSALGPELLAIRTETARPPGCLTAYDVCATCVTGLALASIDAMTILKRSAASIWQAIVHPRRAAVANREAKYRLDGLKKAG